ncbi:MAG TPA: hypothetical protein VJL80_14395 [Aeromicrobium sp.]|nr:hypothetical protein [Aeromicrobium sp.]HKY59223.1 hypothetical protein [Aeromicrobium sp.]
MANLMPAWTLVRVFGSWAQPDPSAADDADWVRSAGTYTVTYPGRITNADDDNMWTGGVYETGSLSTVPGEESLDIMIPATDDPSIEQVGIKATVTINVNGTREVYVIDVPTAARPVETGGTGAGVNLRTIALASSIGPAIALYGVGTPGGLAKLSSDGLSVVDKDGNPIAGGEGGVAGVSSVNGRIGIVTLSKADVGLTNADNTSDANKPVSTATQTALNLKANSASPALTGTPTVPTAAPGTNTTQAASTAFVTAAVAEVEGGGGSVSEWGDLTGTLSDQTDLQAALDAKAASSHTHAATGISDSTSVGRSVLTAADAAAARSAIGASSLAIGTTGSTAMAGNTTLADLGGTPTVVLTQAAYDLIAPGVPGVLYVVSG